MVHFDQQPVLENGKTYYFDVILERGGFKFQSVRGTKNPPYNLWSTTATPPGWIDDGNIAYVVKPIFGTAIPQRGNRAGILLFKDLTKQKSSRMSLRKRVVNKEVKKYAVIAADGVLSLFDKPETPEDEPFKALDIKEAKSVEMKRDVGSLDSVMFLVSMTDTEVYQFTAESATNCTKWYKELEKAKKQKVQAFGARNDMMF
jgi:hypothetical protein